MRKKIVSTNKPASKKPTKAKNLRDLKGSNGLLPGYSYKAARTS